MGKHTLYNTNQKKVGMIILITEKNLPQSKECSADKEGDFIIMR